jgi:hypothetical protein
MNQNLGVVESQLLVLSKNYNIKLPSVLSAFSYINEAKVNCMEIFESRKEEYDLLKLKNCVKKTINANEILKQIDTKIMKN